MRKSLIALAATCIGCVAVPVFAEPLPEPVAGRGTPAGITDAGMVTYPEAPPIVQAAFPLHVSDNKRYLVDKNNVPFLIVGDSPWYMMMQLTLAESEDYLENRRLKGFNALLIELVITNRGVVDPTQRWSVKNPTASNCDGEPPFTARGPAGAAAGTDGDQLWDLSTPNEAYFQHVDAVLTKAAEKGLLVFLAPAWFGGSLEYWQEFNWNTAEKCRAYGRFLGKRYKSFNNIVWVQGGDYDAPVGSVGNRNALEMFAAMREEDPAKLHTFHRARPSTSMQQTDFAPFLDLDATYSGDRTYPEALEAYNRADFRPHFVIESRYEGTENWDGIVNPPELVRANAYWSVLSGSTGQIFGSNYIWGFGWGEQVAVRQEVAQPGWRAGLDAQGSQDMVRLRKIFQSRPWYRLAPDQDHQVVTEGYGAFRSSTPQIAMRVSDYLTAARTAEGKLIAAYVPSTGTAPRRFTVDMTKLSGNANGSWYNPATGGISLISGSPFTNSGKRSFSTPGDNGTKTNDWLLLLEVVGS